MVGVKVGLVGVRFRLEGFRLGVLGPVCGPACTTLQWRVFIIVWSVLRSRMSVRLQG